MMPLERRNEPQMLRQFSKMYPSYNLNPLLRRRHQQLVEAQAFVDNALRDTDRARRYIAQLAMPLESRPTVRRQSLQQSLATCGKAG